jgi:23S rRNA (cytidine1920-2'-O)/16S rRNA (cytidine1409-2'-O)-methyltransferase
MAKVRLDQLVVTRGLASSREEAQRLVLAGQVVVDDRRQDKPGHKVSEDSAVRLKDGATPPRFVSRAGDKLSAALDAFALPLENRRALDCGLSTGGFTDCLLQRGAAHVIGVDVGYGQLAMKLRQDPRVTVMERTNLRHLDAARLPYRPDLVTLDVSFISLTLVLEAVRGLMSVPGDVVALVKPQFEVGKGRVGKGGIVREPELHREAVDGVLASARACGFTPAGEVDSPITGADGNREFLVWLRLLA